MVSEEKKHTFISTGLSSMDDIEKAVKIFRENNCPFELMHCVSTYPMKPEHANLKVINTLQQRYNCDVGYSGHETGTAISIASCAMGATSLERHITLDRSMYGSDQSASLEPVAFERLVSMIRKFELILGDGVKKITEGEEEIAKKLRYWDE